jgi:protein-disulfide isomerase
MAKKLKASNSPAAVLSQGPSAVNQQLYILGGVVVLAILGVIGFVVITQQSAGDTAAIGANENYTGVPLGGRFAEVREEARGSDVAESVSQGILDTELFPNLSDDLNGMPYFGNPDASIIVGEFADFACPACMAYTDTVKELFRDFGRTGDALFIFFPTPLQIHEPEATQAARAGLCAAEQGGFWEMHDEIYRIHRAESPASFTPSGLEDMANAVGLNGSEVRSCMNSNATDEAIVNSRRLQQEVGMTGTPTIVYSLDGGNSWQPFSRDADGSISGGIPYEMVASVIRTVTVDAGG